MLPLRAATLSRWFHRGSGCHRAHQCNGDVLLAGQFTAVLAGKDGAIGIGLVEIYNLR